MKKYFGIGVVVFFLTIFLGNAYVKKAEAISHPVISLPKNAKEVSPNLYDLGKKTDSHGRELQGYAFVKRQENAKSSNSRKPGGGSSTASCYSYLSKGAKWKSNEPWLMNTSNIRGLDDVELFSKQDVNIQKWENAASFNILGSGATTSAALSADFTTLDEINEVYFADISDPGVIGVTVVWGIFGGAPQSRELVSWDQVFDDVDFDWSLTGETGKMDFDNISTHELGHAVGMADLYDSNCSSMTMYGYASEGDTNKATLEDGDINGVSKLY